MDHEKAEKLFSTMRVYGVEYFKNNELEIKMSYNVNEATPSKVQPQGQTKEQTKEIVKPKSKARSKPMPPMQAIPITEQSIPHHENEVANLLRLSDEDLVDKLFPDYSKMPPKQEGA